MGRYQPPIGTEDTNCPTVYSQAVTLTVPCCEDAFPVTIPVEINADDFEAPVSPGHDLIGEGLPWLTSEADQDGVFGAAFGQILPSGGTIWQRHRRSSGCGANEIPWAHPTGLDGVAVKRSPADVPSMDLAGRHIASGRQGRSASVTAGVAKKIVASTVAMPVMHLVERISITGSLSGLR